MDSLLLIYLLPIGYYRLIVIYTIRILFLGTPIIVLKMFLSFNKNTLFFRTFYFIFDNFLDSMNF